MWSIIFWILMIPVILILIDVVLMFIYTIFTIIMDIGFFKILFGIVAFVSFLLLLSKQYAAFPIFAFACLALWIIWLEKQDYDNKNVADKSKYNNSTIHKSLPVPHSLKQHSPTMMTRNTSNKYTHILKGTVATIERYILMKAENTVSDYRKAYYRLSYNKEHEKRYKRYCGYLLATNGWEVEYSGIVLGNKDKGIDLRGFQEGRMKFAQCNYSGIVTHKMAQHFISCLEIEQKMNTNLQVIGVFFCKENKFEEGCRERLEKKGISIQVQDYNNEYPCVKCILASKLYYTPYHAEYDTIRFSIQRGDRHCYDERLAETLGFKKAP